MRARVRARVQGAGCSWASGLAEGEADEAELLLSRLADGAAARHGRATVSIATVSIAMVSWATVSTTMVSRAIVSIALVRIAIVSSG